MTCKYFLPFHTLSFHIVDGLLYYAGAFQFDVILFIFSFATFAFNELSKKIITKINVKKLIYVFYGFGSYVQVFNVF